MHAECFSFLVRILAEVIGWSKIHVSHFVARNPILTFCEVHNKTAWSAQNFPSVSQHRPIQRGGNFQGPMLVSGEK